MKNELENGALLTTGTLVAAFAASLCCIVPVAVAVLGVGTAALGAQLEPLRPLFVGVTVLLLGFAFYRAYKPVPCAPGEACAVPANRRRNRVVLWTVAVVAVLLMAFPYYAAWLF